MEKRRVIFIVEDDPGFNLMLTEYLKSKNKWDIHSFHSGEDCLRELNLKPDIFLQDYDLPQINGLEVFKKVKFHLPDTEFIFLSAQTEIKVVVETLRLGAFDYIVKDNYSKENALNKIDQVVKYKNLLEKKHTDQIGRNVLIILLCLMALFFLIYLILKK